MDTGESAQEKRWWEGVLQGLAAKPATAGSAAKMSRERRNAIVA
jgi:hypothetical protein